MEEQNGNNLQHIEQLLREGRRQDALLLLAEYLRQQSNSVQAWWLLGFAIADVEKQIECMQRILLINPDHKPAQAHLERLSRLKGSMIAPFAPTIASGSAVVSTPPPQQDSPPVVLQRKRHGQVLQSSLIIILVCIAVGIIALDAALIAKPASFTQFFIPPTQVSVGKPPQNLSPTADIPESQIAPRKGFYAPDFDLVNINNNARVSLNNCKGKAIIIYFWATWCGYCKEEMPAVQTLYQEYQSQGLVVLAVDVGESAWEALSYRDANSLTFPILNDNEGHVSSLYRVTGFPTLFFVYPSGIISSVNIGSMDYRELDKNIKKILGLVP